MIPTNKLALVCTAFCAAAMLAFTNNANADATLGFFPDTHVVGSISPGAPADPAADDRGGRRRLGDGAFVLEFLPGDRHARRGHPRLRPEPPAVRHRPPGREGESADRDELLHVQAAPDGPGHDDPAA